MNVELKQSSAECTAALTQELVGTVFALRKFRLQQQALSASLRELEKREAQLLRLRENGASCGLRTCAYCGGQP